MICTVNELTADVRICLDQNVSDAALLGEGDEDTLLLNELIRSKLEGAVERVEKLAPFHMLEGGHHFGDSIHWEEKEWGWTLLPRDFMRLTAFEMSDWERPVYEAVTADTPEYALQKQKVKALRGTWDRPVCAIVRRPEGLALEFYSCRSREADVRRAEYVPLPRIDAHGGIEVSERCREAAVYMAASLVLTTLGENERAGVLLEKIKEALQ